MHKAETVADPRGDAWGDRPL